MVSRYWFVAAAAAAGGGDAAGHAAGHASSLPVSSSQCSAEMLWLLCIQRPVVTTNVKPQCFNPLSPTVAIWVPS